MKKQNIFFLLMTLITKETGLNWSHDAFVTSTHPACQSTDMIEEKY